MIPLVLSLLISQTRADVVGAANALDSAVREARAGSRTFSQNAAKTRLCINPAAGVLPGAKTLRFGVIYLSPTAQRLLGFNLPPGAATWADAGDERAIMEIQAPPSEEATFGPALRENVTVVEEEIEIRASPLNAACEVGVARWDDPVFGTSVRCACWNGSGACTWQRPNLDGSTTPVACPRGVTMAPGSFSGAGAVKKACVTRAWSRDESWPAACPR